MYSARYRRQQGFTLIEIMVSLLIFAVLSVLAWQGLYQMVRTDQVSRTQVAEQNAISATWAVLIQDLLHLRARPVRNRFGDLEPAYQIAAPYALRFSRGGLPVLDGYSPNGMQRVAYAVDGGGNLVRSSWALSDGYREEDARQQIILAGVARLQVEQLDASHFFQPNWPPLNENLDAWQLPRMIRLTLEMQSGLSMTRLVPGLQTLSRRGRADGDEQP